MPKVFSGCFAHSRVLPALLAFLAFSAAYLYTFPQPNVFYAVVVLLHALAGLFASALIFIFATMVNIFVAPAFTLSLEVRSTQRVTAIFRRHALGKEAHWRTPMVAAGRCG